MLKLFLLLSFFPAEAPAKRVMMVPPETQEAVLSPAALKFLGRRVGEELRKCPGLREGARLQSYDDDFKFAGNRTRIAKQIGNAVPPLLGRAIATSVIGMLGSTEQRQDS